MTAASKIIPTHKLDEEDKKVTLDLIYDRRREGYDPLFAFLARFAGKKRVDTGAAADESSLPVEERLKKRIIDGNKIGISRHLDEAMQRYKPLEIINDILLDGMKVVGELFGSGEMQLPFVLQSAEAMKAAVAYLQPFMEKVEGETKGTALVVDGQVRAGFLYLHQDGAYTPTVTRGGMLRMVKPPRKGGDTLWIDTQKGYAALPAHLRRVVDTHSIIHLTRQVPERMYGWPGATCAPRTTCTAFTRRRPGPGASSWCSIFIASMTTRTLPSSTSSPAAALMSTTLPFIGA